MWSFRCFCSVHSWTLVPPITAHVNHDFITLLYHVVNVDANDDAVAAATFVVDDYLDGQRRCLFAFRGWLAGWPANFVVAVAIATLVVVDARLDWPAFRADGRS